MSGINPTLQKVAEDKGWRVNGHMWQEFRGRGNHDMALCTAVRAAGLPGISTWPSRSLPSEESTVARRECLCLLFPIPRVHEAA